MKKIIAVAFMVFIMLPLVANADNFAGTVKTVTLKASVINDVTGKLVSKSLLIQADPSEVNNCTIAITDNGGGYGTVTGDIVIAANNLHIHFGGDIIMSGTKLIGHIPASGSFDVVDSNSVTETTTFDAACYFSGVANSTNTAGSVLIKLTPFNEVNSFASNPMPLTITIPAIRGVITP